MSRVEFFVLMFCFLVAGFVAVDKAVPPIAAWLNSPRHCDCSKCQSDHATFLDGLQTLERIERAMGVNPKPAPMPSILPNQRPLPPITRPALPDDTGRPYIEF